MSATPLSNNNNKPPVSPFKYVCLSEWWLAKPPLQRQGLAVGGVAYGERERVFLSTVIAKRYEANVLETEDGITIQLRGFINSSRTSQNGFPFNVCEDFLLGFPDDWKKYTAHGVGDEYVDGVTGFGESSACSQKRAVDALPFSIHDNNLTGRHVFLLSNNGVLNHRSAPKNICNGQGNPLGNVSKQSVSTDNMECGNTTKTVECKDNTTSLESSQPLVAMMDNGGVSDVAVVSQAGNPKDGQSVRGVYDPNPCTGLSGKSMVGSPISTKKIRKGQLSSGCKEKQHIRRKDAGKTCSKMVTRSISKRSHTLLREDEKVTATSVGPVRRSPRLYNCRK